LFHPTRLKKSPKGPVDSVVPTGTPNRPKISYDSPRKGAKVPDLNALKLYKTWGYIRQFHNKSMFLAQKNNIFGRFGGHMGTINIPTQSRGLRIWLNVSARVPT
jgi:hypothetical protein